MSSVDSTHPLCEACRRLHVEREITEGDPEEPYRVCIPCGKRLLDRTLRPIEWFNLASVHGEVGLLEEEGCFPDSGPEDTGVEPAIPDEHKDPSLEQVADDVQRLLDYCIAWSQAGSEIREALGRHDKALLYRAIRDRIAASRTTAIRSILYEICGWSVGPIAADWVREQWRSVTEVTFPALVRASAGCLPSEEAFTRATYAFAERMTEYEPGAVRALQSLRDPRVLDWIEARLVNPTKPISSAWGYLAASAKITWKRICAWLDRNRPLSLVALDCLTNIGDRSFDPEDGWIPSLEDAPTAAELGRVLEEYLRRDPAPRVEQAVSQIREHRERITRKV